MPVKLKIFIRCEYFCVHTNRNRAYEKISVRALNAVLTAEIGKQSRLDVININDRGVLEGIQLIFYQIELVQITVSRQYFLANCAAYQNPLVLYQAFQCFDMLLKARLERSECV